MSGENVKKIERIPSKRIESPGTPVKGTEKPKRKRIQIVGMNESHYPLYLGWANPG
ncbi:MAG: hypothetical protein Q8Q12_08680 [bacterium]|nr:hypothetical protein [bacterium]